jgi:hypothetical protein
MIARAAASRYLDAARAIMARGDAEDPA